MTPVYHRLNAEPALFESEGYCLFPDALAAEEVEEARSMLTAALKRRLPQPHQGLKPHADLLDRPEYIAEPHARDQNWLDLCSHPSLLDAVESILGPNLILVYSSIFIKLPDSPLEVGWHQDNPYWPSVHGTDVVTMWLALDDADAGNCAMKVIPGSHRGHVELNSVPAGDDQMLGKKVELGPEEEAAAVVLEMSAGSLSIHDSYIVHGSDANHSGRRRAGYTIRYCSTDTAWVDVETHPIPVYHVRGGAGPKGAGYVDLRP